MLVGRESEQRVLQRLIAGARVGSSGVLVITGDPGIGKTALVEEAASRAAGMQVLRARGTESERAVPFGGLLQLLRPAISEIERIPAPQRDALASALALRPGAPVDRFAVGAATLSTLCRLAETSPVALLVDDVHLLDRPSAEALLFAARRLLADPIVLIATARTGEPHPLNGADLPDLHLQGIDLAAAEQIVRARSDRAVPVEVIARLHRTVAGNPLALLELAGDLHRLDSRPPGAPAPVSAMLANAFVARVGRLGQATRTALLVAAAEGGDLGVIAAACDGLDVDVAVLADAERTALVSITVGRVEFRHPLVRSAIYASADPTGRRDAHRAIAAALPPHDIERRAWHLSESVLGTDPDVAAALETAARRAAERGAHSVAAAGFERAARLSPPGDQRTRRLVAAGEVAWAAGQPEQAEHLLDEALTAAPPLPVRTVVHELRGDIAVKCGSPAEARDIMLAAAAETESSDPDAAVGLLVDAVNASLVLGDAGSALRTGRRIEELLPRTSTPRMRMHGLIAHGISLVLAGRGGAEQIRAGVAMLASSGDIDRDRRRLVSSVLGPLFLRESGSGLALVEQAMQESRDHTAMAVLPVLLFHIARHHATTDRWADAETTYDEAVGLSRETGQTTALGINLAGLAWLHAHQGREPDCRHRAAEAIRTCAGRQVHLGMIWARFALGDLDLGRGEPAAALTHFAQLVADLDTIGVVDVDLSPAPELVDVYTRLGRADDATRTAGVFAELAAAKGQPWALARAARAVGTVAPDADMDTHFESALAWHARTLDAFEQARTRLAYGSRLRRSRRRVDARPQLRLAVATFDQLGAARWADVAAAELKATGETARRREPSTADDLTPQERQIALLLAGGRSTREAAAALFLSPKTIEYHTRKVYAKLGIHSRAELADHMNR